MSDIPERCAYYLTLIRLIVDVGTKTVRDLFYFYKPKEKVAEIFASVTICCELLDLKRRHIITSEQLAKLLQEPNPEEMDISLLITLLIHLFKWTVEPPRNGWDKLIPDDDTSLGACLLRLKKIRNTLVGHSADATLSLEKFRSMWKTAECDLTKIACVTGNNNIKILIAKYRFSPLDCCSSRDDEYIELLRTWNKEGVLLLSVLQKEVEELCEKTNEFGLFFKSNVPDRYKRYDLLLMEGGMLILERIFKRELMKSKESFGQLLKSYKRGILLLCRGTNPIYKDETIETDVSKWGLRNLANVTLHLFLKSLRRIERKAITSIRDSCENFARIAMLSLDSDTFRSYWTDLVSSISILSAGLDDSTQEVCHNLIQTNDVGPVNEKAAHMYLLELRRHCALSQSLVHQYLETKEKLKQAVEQMQLEGIPFRNRQVVELKMMTHGTTIQKQHLAEDILFGVWQKAVNLSDNPQDFEDIKEAVNEILNRIKDLSGVKILKVGKSCIILEIECSSCNGLLELLDLLESVQVTNNIKILSQTLSEYCEEKVIVTAFITVDSILKTMESLYDHECISVKITCSTVDAIQHLQQCLDYGKTASNLDQIAQSLSDIVGDDISIVTSMDMGGFEDMYNDKPFGIQSTSKWSSYVLPPDEAYIIHNSIRSSFPGRAPEVIKKEGSSTVNVLQARGTSMPAKQCVEDDKSSAGNVLQARGTSMPAKQCVEDDKSSAVNVLQAGDTLMPAKQCVEDDKSDNDEVPHSSRSKFFSREDGQRLSLRETFKQSSRCLKRSNSFDQMTRNRLHGKTLFSETTRHRTSVRSSDSSIYSRCSSSENTRLSDYFSNLRSSSPERTGSRTSIGSGTSVQSCRSIG